MNTEPTAAVLRDMAENLEEEAHKMRRYADQLERDSDFSVAGFAINSIVNLLGNLRLDLLVIRPVREHEIAIHEAAKEAGAALPPKQGQAKQPPHGCAKLEPPRRWQKIDPI